MAEIILVIVTGNLLLTLVLVRRFEDVFHGFSKKELDYIFRGLQQRMTKARKREKKQH